MMALTDEELPVLNDVVRNGDEAIIRSARLQRVDIDELDSTSTGPLHFELPAHLQFDPLDADSQDDLPFESNNTDTCTGALPDLPAAHYAATDNCVSSKQAITDTALEAVIDEIVDSHITSLRKELRSLLQRARDLP